MTGLLLSTGTGARPRGLQLRAVGCSPACRAPFPLLQRLPSFENRLLGDRDLKFPPHRLTARRCRDLTLARETRKREAACRSWGVSRSPSWSQLLASDTAQPHGRVVLAATYASPHKLQQKLLGSVSTCSELSVCPNAPPVRIRALPAAFSRSCNAAAMLPGYGGAPASLPPSFLTAKSIPCPPAPRHSSCARSRGNRMLRQQSRCSLGTLTLFPRRPSVSRVPAGRPCLPARSYLPLPEPQGKRRLRGAVRAARLPPPLRRQHCGTGAGRPEPRRHDVMAAPYKAPRRERARGGAALRGAVTPSVPPAVPAGSWPGDRGDGAGCGRSLLTRAVELLADRL